MRRVQNNTLQEYKEILNLFVQCLTEVHVEVYVGNLLFVWGNFYTIVHEMARQTCEESMLLLLHNNFCRFHSKIPFSNFISVNVKLNIDTNSSVTLRFLSFIMMNNDSNKGYS